MKLVHKFVYLGLAAALLLTVTLVHAPGASAQAVTCDQTYVVKAGDTLGTIATSLLGSNTAYTQIVEATNNAAKTDTSFAAIADPNIIEVGQKLCIPKAAPGVTPSAPTSTANALTQQQLNGATFNVEDAPGGKVTLSGGKAEVEQAPGSASKFTAQLGTQFANGDLDGNGSPDAAAVLTTSGGGSGTFYYAAVVPNQNGQPGTGVTAVIGDRITVNSLSIANGVLTVNYLDRKPDEPMSTAPSVAATKTFRLQGGQLVAATGTGTASSTIQNIPPGSPAGIYVATTPAGDAPALLYTLTLNLDGTATMLNNYVGKLTLIQKGTWTQTTESQIQVLLTQEEEKNIGINFTFDVQPDRLVPVKFDAGLFGENGLTLYKATSVLTGTVNYNEKIALANNAVVEVYLIDVTDTTKPPVYLNGVSFTTNGQQVPLAFEIPFSPVQIKSNGKYVVQAAISADGRLLFLNNNGVPVLAGGAPGSNVSIIVQPPTP